MSWEKLHWTMDISELVPGEEYIYLGKDGRTGPLRFEGVREEGRVFVFNLQRPRVGHMMLGRPHVERNILKIEQWTRTD